MSLDLDRPTDVVDNDAQAAEPSTRLMLVDCDFHPRVKSLADLKPHMSTRWWEHLQTYGTHLRHGLVQGYLYPKAAPDAHRRDASAADGSAPGSDLDFMRAQYLDPYDVTAAIMGPLFKTGHGDMNADLSAALARATNEWQREALTSREPRLKASIVIPYEDSAASVAEIERCAPHADYAQVYMLTRTSEPMGNRRYWPIYEAAAHHDLPLAVHVFGYGGHPSTAAGWPSYYVEDMTAHSAACQAAISSMVLEGVFERFPKLKLVKIEGGFGWLASLAWRLDKHWMRMRSEVPHLKLPPSEYIRRQVWITTQPFEEAEKIDHALDVIDWIGWDRLLFASDYPHWDFDDPRIVVPRRMGAERLAAIYGGNARAVFKFL